MSYINKSETLNQLQQMVQQNLSVKLDYMPQQFNEEQKYLLELFQKRILLEKTIEETISFNRKIQFENINKNLKLIQNAEELVDVYKLRSDVYKSLGYDKEFPDPVEMLNFDKFDSSSAIVYYKVNGQITGTCRLIFDSKHKLPSEDKFSFQSIRDKYKTIGEISRNIVRNSDKKGLGLEFKYLMAGMHNVFVNNDIDMTLSVLKNDHYRMFSKFGGNEVVQDIKGYGELNNHFLIVSWDPSQASRFFKKAFLS